jgi:hypothetical protein
VVPTSLVSIRVDDLLTIRTLADARAFALSLPADTRVLPKWQNIAEVLVACASTGNSALITVAAGRLQEALSAPEVASALPTPTLYLAASVQ